MDNNSFFVTTPIYYVNDKPHIGHAYTTIACDIFARFHRMKGNAVLMVSGSDAHGTPVVLEAEKKKTTPEKIFQLYHNEFLENWNQLGISFDLFTKSSIKINSKKN